MVVRFSGVLERVVVSPMQETWKNKNKNVPVTRMPPMLPLRSCHLAPCHVRALAKPLVRTQRAIIVDYDRSDNP